MRILLAFANALCMTIRMRVGNDKTPFFINTTIRASYINAFYSPPLDASAQLRAGGPRVSAQAMDLAEGSTIKKPFKGQYRTCTYKNVCFCFGHSTT